jgi:SNF2 family DNA or RNA helicase
LRGLRSPEGLARVHPGSALHGSLRPYQEVGLRWLYLLARLGLGACLADDMGLGKTIQVLALLLVRKRESETGTRRPSLLVAPASLLANWVDEIERFAPELSVLVAHPSAQPTAALKELTPEQIAAVDLVITSYGTVARLPWLSSTTWDVLALDEAQAIKNSAARQTRAVKQLRAHARFALTGTPIENRLGDLWSIFDFINPGLLGTAKEFTAYTKRLAERQAAGAANDNAAPGGVYGPLRELVRPYILRRLKTDRSIITDLPEKTELRAFCSLSREQAALYQQAVEEFKRKLQKREGKADGIERRGIVLAFLTRFKQICNHPSHWLGDGGWDADASGKYDRLRELCEVIAAKQEKVLVFTQFREMTGPLNSFLASVFGRSGLVLSGETEVRRRQRLVDEFQNDEAIPYFVLSLRAGGTGLNLTAASHVIHFDRWWNPAVENQATDRAFRLGQRKNVLVHKFICRGTVEEKIDELIESKRKLSDELLAGGGEIALTELGDDELLRLVSLDLGAARKEA